MRIMSEPWIPFAAFDLRTLEARSPKTTRKNANLVVPAHWPRQGQGGDLTAAVRALKNRGIPYTAFALCCGEGGFRAIESRLLVLFMGNRVNAQEPLLQ